MALSLQGAGVSGGIAIGPIHILDRGELEINEYSLPDDLLAEEIERYTHALNIAKKQLRDIRGHIPASTPPDIAAFIDTHLLMLDDAALAKAPIEIIKSHHCNAEWALKLQRDTLVNVFDEMDDPYLRTRRDDVDHLVNSILRLLLNSPIHHGVMHIQEHRLSGHILVADDLSPADTVLMQHQGVAAFVTESGGPTSHTAILARSLRIPAIVGVHHARQFLNDGETIIVDGYRGWLVASPNEHILQDYQWQRKKRQQQHAEFIKTRTQAAVTLDGTAIALRANIELPDDVPGVEEVGAEGVGLYRTEYLFMNRSTPPDEEEQFGTYLDVIKNLAGKPLTIRTIDLGADKQVDGGRPGSAIGTNPALGLRAIRLCLKEPALFLPQLRAILRVSAFGPVRMMIPMISNTQELLQILLLVQQTKRQLERQNISYDPSMPIGGMVEVPAAALNAEMFLQHLDFLSIGTNDLIQYTLAIDRIDDEVSYLYDPLNPAVLQLIATTLKAGRLHNKPVTMCGEMAGDTSYTRLLLGLGLCDFSMHPNTLPEVKYIITNSHRGKLMKLASGLLTATNHQQFYTQLEAFNVDASGLS